MKMRPFNCSLAFLLRILGPVERVLSFLSLVLPGTTSLQHRRMDWKRYISYYSGVSEQLSRLELQGAAKLV